MRRKRDHAETICSLYVPLIPILALEIIIIVKKHFRHDTLILEHGFCHEGK